MVTPATGRRARLVVAFGQGGTGEDAVAFARRWARAGGDELVVVSVHPGAMPGAGRVDAEWVAYEAGEAEQLLDQARDLTGDVKAEFVRIDASSPARGLYELLTGAEHDTPLLVLGSRRGRGQRRTHPGGTAERLLQGSPSPVAMVPWGYAEEPDEPLSKVAVAYVDTPDGRLALEHGARIAAHLSASLRVISVVPDTRVVPSLGENRVFGQGQAADYAADLERVVAALPAGLDVTGDLREGPVVDALTDLRPQDADVLVCGSRGYGPLRSVLLGGVSSRVLRQSRVPVVVVPRRG